VRQPKPAPDLFLFAAASMKALPEQCVVIEDSALGVMAAAVAGMRALAYCPDGGEDAMRERSAIPFQSMLQIPTLLGID
jgi:beta-phosphoglucomutase-like phosphatase (HAD superfamily)